MTLYTAIGDPERIPEAVKKLFAAVTATFSTENEKTTLTLQDDTRITFHLSHTRDKAAFIDMHTTGMANFFAQAKTANPTLQEKVLQQIRSFNCVVGIVFETDDNAGRTNFIINTLFDLANEVNGYLLYPDMRIYNKEGKLVFSREGESELQDFMPVANADLSDTGHLRETDADTEEAQRPRKTEATSLKARRPRQTAADRERRKRSIEILKKQGIPYRQHIPGETTENETRLKTREEMVQRAATLFAIALYSEVLLSENPDREEAITYFNKMEEIYGIHEWLTPTEKAYLSNPDPDKLERIQFLWRYENCAVLLWAAGIVEELPYPADISDVPVITAIFWQHKGINDLLAQGTARTPEEILDAADLTLCYDWACVDACIHQTENPAKLDGGIAMERHYTFNWIIGARYGWDVTQPTT